MSIKDTFNKLDAQQQRKLVIVGAGLALVVGFLALNSARNNSRTVAPVSADNLLTSADSRALGLGSLNAALERQKDRSADLERRLSELTKKNEAQSKRLEDIEKAKVAAGVSRPVSTEPGDVARPLGVVPGIPQEAPYAERAKVIESLRAPAANATASPEPVVPAPARAPAIVTAGGETAPVSEGDKEGTAAVDKGPATDAKSKPEEEGIFLPAGTIITSVLLSGMDAPTGRSAQSQPLPVLARVKSFANLPNRFRADVSECRVVGSTWGDLSSERAFIRAETFSCVREDGGVIEVGLRMFATGEDGKVGLRGPVVEKRGQLIGRAALAGFLQGVSDAFQPQRIPVLATGSADGNAQFQQISGGDAAQSGIYGGISGASDRLADYYIKRADELVPVIEISAGREATFIVQEGKQMLTVTGEKG